MHERIEELEEAIYNGLPRIDFPVIHSFTPGFYIRQIFMPAGALLTSQEHNTTHTFQITKGIVCVKVNDEEWEALEAPYCGVTKAGTKRVLSVYEDCVFTTFHAITEDEQPKILMEEEVTEAVEKIWNRIIKPDENKLLGGILKENVLHKTIENY